LVKYFQNPERSSIKPRRNEDGEYGTPTKTVLKNWNHNDFTPNHFQQKVPLLLDRTHTPRSATRASTLERNYSTKKWLYNKNSRDEFDATLSKKDLDRNKALRRLTRK
jgi:hypothetical protein